MDRLFKDVFFPILWYFWTNELEKFLGNGSTVLTELKDLYMCDYLKWLLSSLVDVFL